MELFHLNVETSNRIKLRIAFINNLNWMDSLQNQPMALFKFSVLYFHLIHKKFTNLPKQRIKFSVVARMVVNRKG